MRNRRIFIGSSSEYLREAKWIKDLLEQNDAIEGVIWDRVFQPGYLTFEALELMLRECAGAIFIATPDDKTVIRHQTLATPRANVMLEFGLVAGRLGRYNIAVCEYL